MDTSTTTFYDMVMLSHSVPLRFFQNAIEKKDGAQAQLQLAQFPYDVEAIHFADAAVVA